MSQGVTILDAHGRELVGPTTRQRDAMRKAEAAYLGLFGGGRGQFAGARSDKKSLKHFNPRAGSADADLLPDLDELRSRSRDLRRNDPLAAGAYGTALDNVVGCGLNLQATIDADFLGLTDEAADEWESKTERIWEYHARGKRLCITGDSTDVALCNQIFGSVLENGDHFTVRRFVERPGELFGTRVQSVESDRVQTPAEFLQNEHQETADGRLIRQGIEYDVDGQMAAIWVRKIHPGEAYRFGTPGPAPASDFDRIPARTDTGERLVLHHYDKLRSEQSRGVPWFAPVIEPLKQLGRYSEAELMAAVVSSFFTVFVKTETGEGLAGQSTAQLPQSADELNLGTGLVLDLMPNQSIDTADPSRPNTSFDPFWLAMTRQIAVALHFPQELLIKQFMASYSASQAAMLEARRFFRTRRSFLIRSFLSHVYEWVLAEAVARNLQKARGFQRDPMRRQAWLSAEWHGDPWGHLNPKIEVEALAIKDDRGWVTESEATAEASGGDFKRKQRARAREGRVREATSQQRTAPPPEPGLPAADPGDGNQGDD